MKKVMGFLGRLAFIVAVGAAMAFIVMAVAPPVQAGTTVCEGTHKLAQLAMTARQSGASILDVLEIDKRGPDEIESQFTILVRMAYSEPMWETDSRKQREIVEFANQQYMNCVRNVGADA